MRLNSIPGHDMSQLLCMTFSIKRNRVNPLQRTCDELADRWQLDPKTIKSHTSRPTRPRQFGNRIDLTSVELQFLKSTAACKEYIADDFNRKILKVCMYFVVFLPDYKRHKTTVLGTASFFSSPQSANPQPNFNFLNPQPQVRNWTFKSLVRNRKSATTFRDF